ncbi:MAG: hypothetical protein ACUVUR_07915 [bacterium]
MTAVLPLFMLLSVQAQPPDRVLMVGWCPVDSVLKIVAGEFVSLDEEQVLLVEKVGEIKCLKAEVNSQSAQPVEVPIYRLVLLSGPGQGFQRVWQSEMLIGREAVALNLVPDVWAAVDVDTDSLLEVITVKGNSGQVFHFGPDSIFTQSFSISIAGAMVVDVVGADIDLDSFCELVTLEHRVDSSGSRSGVRVWRFVGGELRARGEPVELPVTDSGLNFSLLGSARLEDYPGAPVIILGEYPSLRPSRYYVLYSGTGDSFVLTGTPFPWQEWFSKVEVLAAGRLELFNIGDTLVAYGYFVPGSGAGGSAGSFAALQDGQWRVLRLKEWAQKKVGGLICRLNSGWLELRNRQFYFYPDEPFFWR